MQINTALKPDNLNVQNTIAALAAEYPFVEKLVIGKSVCGRAINALKIGKAQEYTVMAAGMRGTDEKTVSMLMMFAEELLGALKSDAPFAGIEARRAMTGRGLIIIPVLNPDGCEIAIHGLAGSGYFASSVFKISGGNYSKYGANARGIDITHNFDSDWEQIHRMEQSAGIYAPSLQNYGGSRPESEPETAAACSVCRDYNVGHLISFFAGNPQIRWYFGKATPPKGEKIAKIMSESCGYEVMPPDDIPYGASFNNWFTEKYNRPSVSVNIDSEQSVQKTYNSLKEAMLFSMMM